MATNPATRVPGAIAAEAQQRSLRERISQSAGALSEPQYRRYWLGSLASVGAIQVAMIGMLWLIKNDLNGSASTLGYLGGAIAIPTILVNLFGGVFADRLDRRIIMMVISSSIVEDEKESSYEKGLLAERALQVMTPDGAEGAEALIPDDIVISVLPDGTVFIENDEIPRDALDGKLAEIFGMDPKTRIVLRADKTADYELVMDVIARCSNAGLKNIALASKDG